MLLFNYVECVKFSNPLSFLSILMFTPPPSVSTRPFYVFFVLNSVFVVIECRLEASLNILCVDSIFPRSQKKDKQICCTCSAGLDTLLWVEL